MLDGTKLHCLGWWALGPTARAPVGEVAVWEGFFSTNWRPGVNWGSNWRWIGKMALLTGKRPKMGFFFFFSNGREAVKNCLVIDNHEGNHTNKVQKL